MDTRDEFAAADASVALEQLRDVLDPRAREVLRLRYREDLLQRQIGDKRGCSQMHLSRILRDSIGTLCEHDAASPAQMLLVNDESKQNSRLGEPAIAGS